MQHSNISINGSLVLIISSLIFTMFFTNCRRDTQEETELLQGISLNCEPINEASKADQFAVYAELNESKVKLAEIDACVTLSPDQYSSRNIPTDALSAVGGQSGSIYVQLENSKLNFYISSAEEENNFTPLAVYAKNKFQLLRPLHLADLAGYYMHQSTDTSYVLFLGLKGPNLISKLFATGDPMPAQKVLQRALPEFASTPDLPFGCDLNTLSFSSDLGDGQFFWQPDSASITFQEFLGKEGKVAFELMSY